MFVQRFTQWVLAVANFAPSQESYSETILNPSDSVKHAGHKLVISEAIRVSNSCVRPLTPECMLHSRAQEAMLTFVVRGYCKTTEEQSRFPR